MFDFYIFRGNTFFKLGKIKDTYFFAGDKLKITIYKNPYVDKFYYEKNMVVEENTEKIEIFLNKDDTLKLPAEELILEVELKHGPVIKTFQYNILVKEDSNE